MEQATGGETEQGDGHRRSGRLPVGQAVEDVGPLHTGDPCRRYQHQEGEVAQELVEARTFLKTAGRRSCFEDVVGAVDFWSCVGDLVGVARPRGTLRKRVPVDLEKFCTCSTERVAKRWNGEVNEVMPGWERIHFQVASGVVDAVAPKDVA